MPVPRLILGLGLLLGTATAAGDESSLRDRFRDAWTAAQIGEDQASHERQLRNYVLYPYLTAARLRYRLQHAPGAATDAAIARFLDRHGGEPVTRLLRMPWLLSLGERRQWALLRQYIPAETTDPRLRCQLLAARLGLQDFEGLREAALENWMTGQNLPNACDPVAAWLDAQGLLTEARYEQRALLALQSGQVALARAMARRLPDARAAPIKRAAALLDAPGRELPQQLKTGLPADSRLVLSAYWSLARRDSKQAHALLQPLLKQRQFSAEERLQLQRFAALGLAYDHDPAAMPALAALPAEALDVGGHEWRVRTALWFGAWPQVLKWLDAMPEASRQEPRWRYWRARALEMTGELEAAQTAYAAIAHEREYYGFLAAERAGGRPVIAHQALAELPALRAALQGWPGLKRAQELFLVGLVDEATVEWRAALADTDVATRAQAALLAAGWGWHHQAIVEVSALGLWDDVLLRYPLPFDAAVAVAAEESGLPPAWIYSVLRQESLYHSSAVSSADAIGLLQILPSTARQTARRRGLATPARQDLFEPERNILIGSFYLRELLDRFHGRWVLTLAAYNAGPSRVPRWLPAEPMAADVWIENIPFNETRAYVQRILGHQVIFSWRLHDKPTALLPLLKPLSIASLQGE